MVNETDRHVVPPPKISPIFLLVVGILVWVLFFNGFEVLGGLVKPAPTTYVSQTATALPDNRTKTFPTASALWPPASLPIAPAVVAPAPTLATALPVVPTTVGVAQNAATAQVMYEATVAAAAQPHTPVDTGIGSEPNDLVHPTVVAPVNIMETHQCKHGQVWVEGPGPHGCRWPDGRFAERHGSK